MGQTQAYLNISADESHPLHLELHKVKENRLVRTDPCWDVPRTLFVMFANQAVSILAIKGNPCQLIFMKHCQPLLHQRETEPYCHECWVKSTNKSTIENSVIIYTDGSAVQTKCSIWAISVHIDGKIVNSSLAHMQQPWAVHDEGKGHNRSSAVACISRQHFCVHTEQFYEYA